MLEDERRNYSGRHCKRATRVLIGKSLRPAQWRHLRHANRQMSDLQGSRRPGSRVHVAIAMA